MSNRDPYSDFLYSLQLRAVARRTPTSLSPRWPTTIFRTMRPKLIANMSDSFSVRPGSSRPSPFGKFRFPALILRLATLQRWAGSNRLSGRQLFAFVGQIDRFPNIGL